MKALLFLLSIFSSVPPSANVEKEVKILTYEEEFVRIFEEKRVKILSDRAKEDYGTVVIPFDASKEEISVLYAFTILPNGDTIEVTENAINYVSDPLSEEFPFLSNRKELHISFLSIERGSELAYALNRRLRNPEYIEGIEFFGGQDPVKYKRLTFCLPKDFFFNFLIREANEKVKINKFDYDSLDYRIYSFESSEIPSAYNLSSRWSVVPPTQVMVSQIIYTTFPSWDSLFKHIASYYKKLDGTDFQSFSFSKFKEMVQKIQSPENISFSKQGYLPEDRERAKSGVSMTYPEKILRLRSAFKDLYPVVILDYSFDTLNSLPSFRLIRDIALYDGENFIFPLKDESKIRISPYHGYTAVILFPEDESFELRRLENPRFINDSITINLKGRHISFKKSIPTYNAFKNMFSGFYNRNEDDDEINNKTLSKGLKDEFDLFGNVKTLKFKVKNKDSENGPILIEGKAKVNEIGFKSGGIFILRLPVLFYTDESSLENGLFLRPGRTNGYEYVASIYLPRKYSILFAPKEIEYEDENLLLKRKITVKGDIVIYYFLYQYKNVYISAQDLVFALKELENRGLFYPQVLILRGKD